ncbi:MAG: ribonuclease P protein component [Rhodobacterales bacterium]|nr:ribonuclease P protein component [Rhodobacterales bacterium]
MSAALPRLKRRSDFLRVARAGRKWAAPGLVLQVRPHRRDERFQGLDPDHRPPLRVGFTVSKKVGNAVVRNRARRRLRALAEALLPVHARAGHDVVLIGRAATPTRPFAALEADLLAALKRVKALRPETDEETDEDADGPES